MIPPGVAGSRVTLPGTGGVIVGLVLVVEDDPINASLVHAILARDGHRVLLAADGVTALDTARRRLPDVVLLDVSLPGELTGLDVCRQLRADPATAAIGVLMLSGWVFDSDVAAGYDAGADDYLAKPYQHTELRQRVQTLIDRTPARKTDTESG